MMIKFNYIWMVPIILLMLFITRAEVEEMDLTKVVIHHSASLDVSVSTIDNWHRQRGFSEIGYHFVIRANGKIEKGRDIHKKGAHAKGRNNYIGICLTGYDSFTDSQIKSLIMLLRKLGIKEIYPHHEKCPGKGIDWNYIRNSI